MNGEGFLCDRAAANSLKKKSNGFLNRRSHVRFMPGAPVNKGFNEESEKILALQKLVQVVALRTHSKTVRYWKGDVQCVGRGEQVTLHWMTNQESVTTSFQYLEHLGRF